MEQTVTPESEIIGGLRSSQVNVDDLHLGKFERYFQELRELDDIVARASSDKLYEAQWSVLGIINRCYELMLCAIEQLSKKNWNGTYAAVRGLAESLGAVAWVLENTARLPSLVQFDQVGIGKIMKAGYSRHPNLKELYSSVSSIVHPGRDSHLLGFREPLDRTKVMMSPFSMDLSDAFAQQKINIITSLAGMICESLRELVSRDHNEVIKQGRVMMWRGEEAQPTDGEISSESALSGELST